MKHTLLVITIALALAGGFVGCASTTDTSPKPMRPPGSGGRGLSPGQADHANPASSNS